MANSLSRRSFVGIVGASATVLGLGLAGCSDNSSSGSADSYIIATDTTFAPFEFTNDNNEFVGIDVDTLAACAEVSGFEYELQSLGFDAAVAALESGQADGVIAGMSITPEREEKYDFSDPYYDSSVCAAAAENGDVKSLDDLSGRAVACKTGTQSAAWAESIKDQYGFTINYFDQSDMMYQDVLTGNTAACFEDYPVMAYGVSQGNGLTIIGENKDEFSTPYGFAVLKGQNAELLSAFNEGLAEIRSNGTYDEILNKYLEA